MRASVQPSCSCRCQKGARITSASVTGFHAARDRTPALVAHAISKSKKVEIVDTLKCALQESHLAYNFALDGIRVVDVEAMRRGLPEGARMIVAKNRLVRVAIDQLEDAEQKEKWAGLKSQKGMNAYIFAGEDDIRGSVKAYGDMFKALKAKQAEPKKGAPPPPPPTEVRTVVLDGEVLDSASLKALEDMPTKQELLTQIAIGIKANPTKIALAIKAVPRKIAYGIKAISELNEDESMTVADALAAKQASES